MNRVGRVLRRRLGVTAEDARQRVPTGFKVRVQFILEQAALHEPRPKRGHPGRSGHAGVPRPCCGQDARAPKRFKVPMRDAGRGRASHGPQLAQARL